MNRRQEPAGLGLDRLGPTDFTAFYGDIGIVGHVLGLKGGHFTSPFFEYPGKRCCGDRFSHITAGSQKHDGFWTVFDHQASSTLSILTLQKPGML